MNSQCDQHLDGLIAQLVEYCTGIAEVMGSNPIQARIFSGFNFTTALKVVCITAMIMSSYLSLQFKYMIFHILICIRLFSYIKR